MTLNVNFDSVSDDYRLCFVRVHWAFFTRISLDSQWGEHWDNVPYQLHAGLPYSSSIHPIFKVAFDGPFFPPEAGRNGHARSARELNEGAAPWLRTESYFHGEPVCIMASVTLRQFQLLVRMAGGTMYAPIDWGRTAQSAGCQDCIALETTGSFIAALGMESFSPVQWHVRPPDTPMKRTRPNTR